MERDPDTAELTMLPRDECIQLLRTQQVGRLAVAKELQAPLVVPVNYVMDGEAVVFRTDDGTKLTLLRYHPVSFEVDAIDGATRTGWSVLVTGWAHEASEWEVGHLQAAPWGPGEKEHWVRIVPETITGRRIVRHYDLTFQDAAYLF